MPLFELGELFCGPGGLAYGAVTASIEQTNYRIIHKWAVDYDKDTCETYRRNICPDEPESVYCDDVRTFDMSRIEGIDAFAFGFPCNDFGIADDPSNSEGLYSSLYFYGIKAVKHFRPLWFLAENGGRRTNADNGSRLGKILEVMRSLGYNTVPHLYKFEEYGVPQARHRIIIIGIRNDINVVYRVPSPEPYRDCDNTCRTAIENPPISPNASNHEFTRQSDTVRERLKYIKPGENAYTANIPPELQLNVRGARISQTYKRLDPDKPSYTIMSSGGGGTHIYHWSEPRALTNRERARLQTFPDDYVFIGSKESVRKQIGMAVPCMGARIIFESVLKSFAGIPYEYTEPNIDE